jgi:hypothetical protein
MSAQAGVTGLAMVRGVRKVPSNCRAVARSIELASGSLIAVDWLIRLSAAGTLPFQLGLEKLPA